MPTYGDVPEVTVRHDLPKARKDFLIVFLNQGHDTRLLHRRPAACELLVGGHMREVRVPDQPGQFALGCRLGQPREVVVHHKARVDVLEEVAATVATGASAPAT